MSILNGWSFVLQNAAKENSQVIILDQGPVFLLAEMREFGPEYLKGKKAEKLWQELYSRWAATLDMIVWLDAADIYLLERIRTRGKGHVVKNEAAPIVIEFLARYRKTYDYTLSMLETNASGPRVLRFDTGTQKSQEIADRLLVEFGIS
jgi:deoxyadenosine/deoxycytidine kinase